MRLLTYLKDKAKQVFSKEPAVVVAGGFAVLGNLQQYVTDNWNGQDGWKGLGLVVVSFAIRQFVSPTAKVEAAREEGRREASVPPGDVTYLS